MALADAHTLVDALRELPRRPGRGFRFLDRDRNETFHSYGELHAEAERRAAHLQAQGLKKGDRLALVIPDGREFVLSFLGAVCAGVVPVPIYPRASFRDAGGYADVVAHIARAAAADHLLTSEGMLPLLDSVTGAEAGPTCHLVERLFEGAAPAWTRPDISARDLCFLQFTSGSTSEPKGVTITHGNLVANSRAFLGPSGLNRNDQDVGVSWLPLYHDMGLIGFVLGTLICDIPVVLLPTEAFGRTPRIWLETIQRFRGTITYAPNFAFNLLARRIKDRDLENLDLSCLRVTGCGAEPIRASTLREFQEKLAPAGFDGDRTFLPSYGMAESTLAITFHELGTPMVVDRVDNAALRAGRAVPGEGDNAVEIVSCGRPFPGHELTIVDETGGPLPERVVGEITVSGPSVTEGYFQNPEATAAALRDGRLHTGDLGYCADGNLFVCGRLKDLLVIRGENHHPQDIEWVVSDLEGVRRGNAVAFGTDHQGTEGLVVAAECTSRDAARLRTEVGSAVGRAFGLTPVHVAVVAVGSLPKTSSGKAQRRKTRNQFERGELKEHP